MANNSHNNEGLEKAMAFFERAAEVAATGNFDYAIDMYLEGLRRAPDAVEEGHIPLRQVALLRQTKGGKKPSMMDKLKHTRSKDALEELLNQEWLFARDPDNLSYAENYLKAAITGGFKKTAAWVADMVFESNVASAKPSFATFILLKEAFAKAGQWEKAIRALQYAIKLRPQELALADELRNLSAELAVKKGKYDQEGDFRKSIKDKEEQDKLQAQDAVVKTEDYKVIALRAARQAYAKEPGASDVILKLAEALADIGTDETFREATQVLEKAAAEKQDFNFKRRSGELKIKQLAKKIRAAKGVCEANPQNAGARAVYEKLVNDLNNTELEHFRACVENYPTDTRLKFEYGNRLLRNKRFDDAIPMFQEAQKDPRHKIAAMDKIGLCFFYKGWHSDAIDIFRQAIDAYEIKDDAAAKELRYNLARALEEKGDAEEALEIYRKLAQLDFGFKDVRQRVDNLRKSG